MHSLLNDLKQDLYGKRRAAIWLQLLALSLAWVYFLLPGGQTLFDGLAAIKTHFGLAYAVTATAFFGGVIPFVWQFSLGQYQQARLPTLLTLITLWAFMGFLVDNFYAYQSLWFGDTNDALTLLKKVSLDQFVFSTFLTCPIISLTYRFIQHQCQWQSFLLSLQFEQIISEIARTVITNWIIWIPSVCLIYSLPLSLQVPMFNIVLCFFALVMAQRQETTR